MIWWKITDLGENKWFGGNNWFGGKEYNEVKKTASLTPFFNIHHKAIYNIYLNNERNKTSDISSSCNVPYKIRFLVVVTYRTKLDF